MVLIAKYIAASLAGWVVKTETKSKLSGKNEAITETWAEKLTGASSSTIYTNYVYAEVNEWSPVLSMC